MYDYSLAQGSGMASSKKLVRLPHKGRLLCAADLRGNLRDLQAVLARFEALGDSGHLLLLGDVVHGPLGKVEWPPGVTGYRDESPGVLLKLSLLKERHPDRVFLLLGEHEHGHVGGPHTSRFADDEVAALEGRLGREAAEWLKGWLQTWPLWAVSPSGVLFSHRAPSADVQGAGDIEAVQYGPVEGPGPEVGLLRAQLYGQPVAPERARRVLAAVGAHVAVYGHEVVAGHEVVGAEQLILTSSFGAPDGDKQVLELDLSRPVRTVSDLRPGIEIVPLYG